MQLTTPPLGQSVYSGSAGNELRPRASAIALSLVAWTLSRVGRHARGQVASGRAGERVLRHVGQEALGPRQPRRGARRVRQLAVPPLRAHSVRAHADARRRRGDEASRAASHPAGSSSVLARGAPRTRVPPPSPPPSRVTCRAACRCYPIAWSRAIARGAGAPGLLCHRRAQVPAQHRLAAGESRALPTPPLTRARHATADTAARPGNATTVHRWSLVTQASGAAAAEAWLGVWSPTKRPRGPR